jgi:hypothetical protein
MTAAIPNSHQGGNRRSGRFSQRDESAVRDSAHMPSGRTFLANHAATRASASGSPLNSTGAFGPRFWIEVTTTLPSQPGEVLSAGSPSRYPGELACNEPNLRQRRPNP